MTRGNAPAMRPGAARPSGFAAVMADRDRSADDVDFFPTRPWGGRAGAEIILKLDPRARSVWECAVGAGHLAHGLKDYFPTVHTSDLCRYDGNRIYDFLSDDPPPFRPDWIATNPPFDHAEDFIRLAWARATRGVAMLMRGACLEGQARYRLLYEECPYYAYAPFSERLAMHKGFWDPTRTTATMYAWFFFLKPGVGPRRRPPYPYVIPIAPGAEARLTGRDDARLFAARDFGAEPKFPLRIGPGQVLTAAHAAVLRELAKTGERGSCAVPGVMDGGLLAALVQFELAERMAPDRLGGLRYRVAANGRTLLADLGWSR